MPEIVYYGVFLDEESRSLLRDYTDSIVGAWEEKITKHCHHMTIIHHSMFGDYPQTVDWCNQNEGKKVFLKVWKLGMSPRAIALEVIPYLEDGEIVPCENRVCHITLCTIGNALPYESNEIHDWVHEKFSAPLVGYVRKWCTQSKESRDVSEEC